MCCNCNCNFSWLFKDDKKRHEVVYSSPVHSKEEKVFHFQQPPCENKGMGVGPHLAAAPLRVQPRRRAPNVGWSEPADPVQLSASSTDPPLLHLSLFYDIRRQSLRLHVKRLRSPASTGVVAITVRLHPGQRAVWELEVAECAHVGPSDDKTVEFPDLSLDDVRSQALLFRVYTYESGSKGELIGATSLQLADATDLQGTDIALPIESAESSQQGTDIVLPIKSAESSQQGTDIALPIESAESSQQGTDIALPIESAESSQQTSNSNVRVLLALVYNAENGTLHGVLLRVANVSSVMNPDRYVKINLLIKGQRLGRWRSTTKPNISIAVYNEGFSFDVKNLDINEIMLQLVVLDEDRLHTSRDRVVGYTTLGHKSQSKSGRKQWQNALTRPGTLHTSWHSTTL